MSRRGTATCRPAYNATGRDAARIIPGVVEPETVGLDPKPRPNHRRYLEVLGSMTPEQRLLKAFELAEMDKAAPLAVKRTDWYLRCLR